MRTNKQELQRLRIKSELGQKMMQYQQTKTTQKAQQEKQKYLLKQQIMQDILRKKLRPQPPTQPPPHPSPKDDSKLYSFGFPNPRTYVDEYQAKEHHLQKSKQYETSGLSEESSMPFIDAMRNKYVIPESESDANQHNPVSYLHSNNHNEQYEEESREEENETDRYEQNQSFNPSVEFIDKEIPSSDYAFDRNISNRYAINNNINNYDIENKSSKYEMQNRSNKYQIESKSNKYQIESKSSKYEIDNKSIKYEIENKSNKYDIRSKMDEFNNEDPSNLNRIDIAASQLSKQFMKNTNSSGLLKGSYLSSQNLERSEIEESGSFQKIATVPPKLEKKPIQKMYQPVQPMDDSDVYKQDQPNVEESYQQPRLNSHKAYGGYIKEGHQDDDYLQELRKKKIQELEKKRLNRNEERKKSQDLSIRLEKSNVETDKKESYVNDYKKEQNRKADECYNNDNHNLHLPPVPPEKKQLNNPKSRTSSEAEQRRSSIYDKNSERERKASPHQVSSIQSSSSKGLLKTPKSSIFESSPNRPKDKSLGRLFQDPKIQPKQRKQTFSKQSNKKMMINAITNVCLPGQINRKEREKLLEILESSAQEYFIFLFKEYSRNVVKAVYTYDSTSGEVTKIHGDKAPNQIHEEDVSKFLRFDSGAKEFKILDGCKSFSYAVHAIYIK